MTMNQSLGRSLLPQLLADYKLSCIEILSVDDIVVSALFSRASNKAPHRRHQPLTLAKGIHIPGPLKAFIYELFEERKREFYTGDGRRTIAIAKELAETISVQHVGLNQLALTW